MDRIDRPPQAGWLATLGTLAEDRLLFGRPGPLRTAPPGPEDSHFSIPVRLAGPQALSGVVARPLRDALGVDGSVARSVLLWFGGRNEDIRWTPAIASWLGPEFAVASFAYRGRAGSGGVATQAAVVDDGVRIVRWLAREENFGSARLLLAGRSLGSAVAMQVLARLDGQAAGLILLSPMDSVRALVGAHRWLAPAARWLFSPFDSLQVAHAVRCPTLVLLAAHDERVPAEHSRRLVETIGASAPRLEVQAVAGTTHRSLPRSAGALEAMRRFAGGAAG